MTLTHDELVGNVCVLPQAADLGLYSKPGLKRAMKIFKKHDINQDNSLGEEEFQGFLQEWLILECMSCRKCVEVSHWIESCRYFTV